MSDFRHGPYGADDDPFLTPPAGPGTARVRAAGASYWDGDDLPRAAAAGEYGDRGGVYGAARDSYQADYWPDTVPGYAADPYGQAMAGQSGPSAMPAQPRGDDAPAMFIRHRSPLAAPPRSAPQPMTAGRGFDGYSDTGPELAQWRAAQAYAQAQPWDVHDAGAAASHRPYPDAARGDHGYDPAPSFGHGQGYGQAQGQPQGYGQGYAAHYEPETRAPAPPPAQSSPQRLPRILAYPSPSAPEPQSYAPAQGGYSGQYSLPQRTNGYPEAYADAYPNRAHPQPSAAPPLAAQLSAQLTQWAGAACTLLAVIGAGYWGYDLALRDASGIPVVRASASPLRIAPQEPGGEVSAHQGLSVNAIPALGSTAEVPDQVTLAPQTTDLAPVDTGTLPEPTRAAGKWLNAVPLAPDDGALDPSASAAEPSDLTALTDAVPEDLPLSDAEAVERALAAALAEGGDPQPLAEDTAVLQPAPAPEQTLAQAGEVGKADLNPALPPLAEMDPASIAVGTPLVQFGAFDSAETARAEWANLQARFAELMVGKALVVEAAKSGGRDFYRLRAHGFASADDTRRFCAAILAENGTCLTVDQR